MLNFVYIIKPDIPKQINIFFNKDILQIETHSYTVNTVRKKTLTLLILSEGVSISAFTE